MSDDGLAQLAGLENLKVLELDTFSVTDAGMAEVGKLTGLTSLRLPSQITDEGLAHLGGLKNLEKLGLAFARVTDAGLKNIAGMSGMTAIK